MTDRSTQPAVLLRKIARLEALLSAEQQRAEKAWEGYRDALHAKVEAELQLQQIREVLDESLSRLRQS